MHKTSEPDRLKGPVASERRRSRRVALAFQIEVSGRDRTGGLFNDQTTTIDVSEEGCQFPSQRKLCIGDHLSLSLVNTEFARLTGNKIQSFEVVWVEPGRPGWTIGVRKLGGETIWPLTFPLERKLPSEL